ncbi:unnamed protein product [Nesidiocoris tenuis]|uniref:Uncharacterized protein n=1 Tax=Nesidiocoris tenuis TaxID=355587 RepID=A0A6H5FXS2_9HEMI|nr:unnamed protein product [Nesidiocoris tenuis]
MKGYSEDLRRPVQVCRKMDVSPTEGAPMAYPHPCGELWHLHWSPQNESLISTCYNSLTEEGGTHQKCGLWHLTDGVNQLKPLATLDTEDEIRRHRLQQEQTAYAEFLRGRRTHKNLGPPLFGKRADALRPYALGLVRTLQPAPRRATAELRLGRLGTLMVGRDRRFGAVGGHYETFGRAATSVYGHGGFRLRSGMVGRRYVDVRHALLRRPSVH